MKAAARACNALFTVVFMLGCHGSHPAHERRLEQDMFQAVMSEDPTGLMSHGPAIDPPAVKYVEQTNGLWIPDTDWDRGEQRYLILNESDLLEPHEQTVGHIEHESQRYDCRMDLVDSNLDSHVDLARLTVDYHIRRHRDWNAWGRVEQGRAILQDYNYDGVADRLTFDIYDGHRRGIDGTYERAVENGGHKIMMDYFLEHWIIFVGGDSE